MADFVGRVPVLARLTAALEAVGVGRLRVGVVLVGGTSGIGKTALLHRFADLASQSGARTVWGGCWGADQAPAFWPWIQVFRALAATRQDVPPDELLAMPGARIETLDADADADAGARFRLLDAAGRYLAGAAANDTLVVLLDDLQWADTSTMELLRFLAADAHPAPILLVGAFRDDETSPHVAELMRELTPSAELITLTGLDAAEVTELLTRTAGQDGAARWAPIVHERTGGHPFFVRELAHLIATGGTAAGVPGAVRELIARRVSRLSPSCARLLETAAVAAPVLLPDVLAEAAGRTAAEVSELLEEAEMAGVLTGPSETTFTHDLIRESIYTSLTSRQRARLHHRVARALQQRRGRGGPVFAAELARHYCAALPEAEPGPVILWARAAADEDRGRYAFNEAAAHLARARLAVAGIGISAEDLVGLLTAEADARLRAGDADHARNLLKEAWQHAHDPQLMATVALGMDRIGARFAMPRADLVTALERTHAALSLHPTTGSRARVTAALARQLQHSVPRDRTRAAPLAAEAVALARGIGSADVLADCLLAQHDVLWTPGRAADRLTITTEIMELALDAGNTERHAQALLLTATAQLESGSPAFRATLTQFQHVSAELQEPRHDYLRQTREAMLALLDGDLDHAERLIEQAADLGMRIGEPDAGNVRMSQLLELARARNDPPELQRIAREAIGWWVGAPVHAHAVAAGLLSRAGEPAEAKRAVSTVTALGWREDQSYLRSIFIGELAVAAVTIKDQPLCSELLDELTPLAEACAVNGALVTFMGAHAHHLGLLHAALDQPDEARAWLERALGTHQRLGARTWTAHTQAELAELAELRQTPPREAQQARLKRTGDLWEARFAGRTAYLRDSKGLRDLAALLNRPGTGIPAIELAAADLPATSAQPVLDRAALTAYRRRLTELDAELDDATAAHDTGRLDKARTEKEQLLTELRRATRPGGAPHDLGRSTAERARKAVTGRIRAAIRHLDQALPELGRHLDATIQTGTICTYLPGTPRQLGPP
jgi:hypothetical protein